LKKNENVSENVNVNREYKNTVFSLLFSDPDVLRELFSAIEGVDLPPDIQININTLSDVLFKRQINDISFTVGNNLVVLIEHQSTVSNNMPLRLLKYIVSVYDKIIDHKKLYREKTVKIPKPRFIVLYNGDAPYPNYKKLRLCDAFMDDEGLTIKGDEDDLGVNVHIYNINRGHNEEILKKCEALDGYSLFVDMIQEYKKEGIALAETVTTIVKYCIDNNILGKFFRTHGSEVYNMIIAEYDPKEEIEALTEEAWEEGLEEGLEKGHERGIMTTARNALAKGLPTETIQEITGLDMAVIEAMSNEKGK
jgi:hypothetical protein